MRLVAAGATPADALREVARGALEDWYGLDFESVARPGLTARIRARLGAAWDPADGLLLYLLSQVVDDRISSPVLRNPFWRDAWRYFGESGEGNRELRAGQGATFTTTRQRMRGGGLRLVQSGPRGAFELSSDEAGVRFAIARIR